MKQTAKRIVSLFLSACMVLTLLPMTVSAATAEELVTTINGYVGLTATADGNTVTVTNTTGAVVDAAVTLDLDIDADVTVVWEAEITAAESFGGNLIAVSGGGAFEVADGGAINATTGTAIYADTGTVTVNDGGTVSAAGDGGYAIYADNASTVTVNDGGTVSATGLGTAIYANGSTVTVNNGGTVSAAEVRAIEAAYDSEVTVNGGTVSATGPTACAINLFSSSTVEVNGGTVSATGEYGYAIYTHYSEVTMSGGAVSADGTYGYAIYADTSTVTVNDGGTVSTTTGTAIGAYNNATVTVNGGTVSAAGEYGYAIHADHSEVTVSGGTVSADSNDGKAIYAVNSSSVTVDGGAVSGTTGYAIHATGTSTVMVSGGTVSATMGYAINNYQDGSIIKVDGGAVFAYGTDLADVIHGTTPTINDPGVVIAWDQDAGIASYHAGTSDDLAVFPDGATAVWATQGNDSGIAYENGANSGFIKLPVTVTDGGTGSTGSLDLREINASANDSGPGWTWEASTKTLTIDSGYEEGFTITGAMGTGGDANKINALIFKDDTHLKLMYVRPAGTNPQYFGKIYSGGKLTIEDSYLKAAFTDDLYDSDWDATNAAIYAADGITLLKGANIDASVSDGNWDDLDYVCAVWTAGDFVSRGGSLTATNNANVFGFPIQADGDMEVTGYTEDGGTTPSRITAASKSGYSAVGIDGTLTVDEGHLNASSTERADTLDAYGMELKSGSVTVTAAGNGSAAIRIDSEGVKVSGGELSAKATGENGIGLMLYSGIDNNLEVSGGKMTLSGTEQDIALGSSSQQVTVTGGALDAEKIVYWDTPSQTSLPKTVENAAGTTLYKTRVTGLDASLDVIGISSLEGYGSDGIGLPWADSQDADNGYLVLWLPAGEQTVTIAQTGKTYTGSLTVAPDYNNAVALAMTVPPEPAYGLTVGGVAVTDANKGRITGEGITGTVSYDPATKTLTLNNATITPANIPGEGAPTAIVSDQDLTVKLIGANVLGTVPQNPALSSDYTISNGIYADEKDITVTGSGSLTIYDYFSGIYGKNVTVDITGTLTVRELGTGRACCLKADGGTLTVKRGTLNLSSLASNGLYGDRIVINGGTITAQSAEEQAFNTAPEFGSGYAHTVTAGNDAASARQISSPTAETFTASYVKIAPKTSGGGNGGGSSSGGGRTVVENGQTSGQPASGKPVVSVKNDPQGKPVVTVGASPLPNAKPLTAAEIAQRAANGTLNGTVNPNGVWDGKTTGTNNVALVIDTREATLTPGGSQRLGVSAFAGPTGCTLRVRASRDGFVTITVNADGTYTITALRPVSDLYILVEILDASGNVIGHSSMKLNAAAGLTPGRVENKAATIA